MAMLAARGLSFGMVMSLLVACGQPEAVDPVVEPRLVDLVVTSQLTGDVPAIFRSHSKSYVVNAIAAPIGQAAWSAENPVDFRVFSDRGYHAGRSLPPDAPGVVVQIAFRPNGGYRLRYHTEGQLKPLDGEVVRDSASLRTFGATLRNPAPDDMYLSDALGHDLIAIGREICPELGFTTCPPEGWAPRAAPAMVPERGSP